MTDDDFQFLMDLCAQGDHCPCFADGEPCCYCDRLQGEVTDGED